MPPTQIAAGLRSRWLAPTNGWHDAWERSAANGDKVYLHIFEWSAGGRLNVPPLENQIVSSYLLAVPDRSTVPVTGREGGGQLDLSGRCPQKHATVVALTLDDPPKVPEKAEAAAQS